MTQHIYFGIEALNLTAAQRDTLITALRALGPASDASPARLCHWRTRLDNNAAIFEAAFEESHITIDAFKARLGMIFGVDPSTIAHVTPIPTQTFLALPTRVLTLQRPAGTNRIRVVFFGYDGAAWPTWEQSGAETRAYLAANQVAWEGSV